MQDYSRAPLTVRREPRSLAPEGVRSTAARALTLDERSQGNVSTTVGGVSNHHPRACTAEATPRWPARCSWLRAAPSRQLRRVKGTSTRSFRGARPTCRSPAVPSR